MPLKDGNSQEVISENIKKLMAEGMPREQAIAVALEHARKTSKNKGNKHEST